MLCNIIFWEIELLVGWITRTHPLAPSPFPLESLIQFVEVFGFWNLRLWNLRKENMNFRIWKTL